jgi:hypothetical protein
VVADRSGPKARVERRIKPAGQRQRRTQPRSDTGRAVTRVGSFALARLSLLWVLRPETRGLILRLAPPYRLPRSIVWSAVIGGSAVALPPSWLLRRSEGWPLRGSGGLGW